MINSFTSINRSPEKEHPYNLWLKKTLEKDKVKWEGISLKAFSCCLPLSTDTRANYPSGWFHIVEWLDLLERLWRIHRPREPFSVMEESQKYSQKTKLTHTKNIIKFDWLFHGSIALSIYDIILQVPSYSLLCRYVFSWFNFFLKYSFG